jgi:hypothetical protein
MNQDSRDFGTNERWKRSDSLCNAETAEVTISEEKVILYLTTQDE